MGSQPQLGNAPDTDWLSVLLDEPASAGADITEVPQEAADVSGCDMLQESIHHMPLPAIADDDIDLGFLDSLLSEEVVDLPSDPMDLGAAPTLDTAGLASPCPVQQQLLQQQPCQQQQQQPTVSGSSSHSAAAAALQLQQQPYAASPSSGGPWGSVPAQHAVALGSSAACSPATSGSERQTPPATPAGVALGASDCGATCSSGGSGASARSRAASPTAATAAANSGGCGSIDGDNSGDGGGEESEERKRQARMLRNRESAQLSRQRKKMQMGELERRNNELGSQVKYLGGLVSQLGQENALLRGHLCHVCQTTGTPLPPMAASPPPGTPGAPLPPGAVPVAYAPPGCTLVPPPHGCYAVPVYGYTPKLPIQKLAEPARPAPAAKPSPAAASSAQQASGAKRPAANATAAAPKRAKAAAGGSAALLALFALVMFAGSPATLLPGSNQSGSAEPYAAVQATAAPGRVLHSVAPPASATAALNSTALSSWAAPPAGAPGNATAAALAAAITGNNATATSADNNARALALLLPQGGNAEAESAALQRLIDAGEAALVWDPSWADAVAAPPGLAASAAGNGVGLMPSDWADFPSLLGATFRADNLMAPIGCEKVFEVDASHVPGHDKLKRKMDSWVSSVQGFRGRAVPLPPASTEPQHKERIGGGAHHAPGGAADVLVSVVLPAKRGGVAAGGLAALERIFVVVLQQSTVYATYSCQLPRLGAGVF